MIPSVMKAWRIDAYNGDPALAIKSLKLKDDVPVPSAIQDHQLLLKIQYASVNPIDWKLLTGGLHGICPCTFPYTPGFDVGGTVVQAGAKVSGGIAVGDAVIADIGLVESCTDPPTAPTGCAGAFAEYVAVDSSICVKVPTGAADLEKVTGLPLAGLTAYQALFTGEAKSFTGETLGSVKEGSKVLILGGSGGVGTLAIQMAKTTGCHVACTSSKVSFCKELGADQVINYKDGEDWSKLLAGQNYDLIFDCIGLMKDLTEGAPKVLKKRGDFVSVANFDPTAASSDSVRFAVFLLKSSAKDLETMMGMIKDRTLKVPVETVYDLKDVPAALEKSLSGRSAGKVLIKMQ